jgi:hypothetical protein
MNIGVINSYHYNWESKISKIKTITTLKEGHGKTK